MATIEDLRRKVGETPPEPAAEIAVTARPITIDAR